MKKVLILDENADIRTILSTRITQRFAVKAVAKSLKQARQELELSEFALVVSDVEDSETDGFWLHRFLRENYPQTRLILFVSERRMLRNIPMFDSALCGAAVKFEYDVLDMEIAKLKILKPLSVSEDATDLVSKVGREC